MVDSGAIDTGKAIKDRYGPYWQTLYDRSLVDKDFLGKRAATDGRGLRADGSYYGQIRWQSHLWYKLVETTRQSTCRARGAGREEEGKWKKSVRSNIWLR